MEKPEESVADLLSQAREGDEQGKERLFQACRGYLHYLARTQVETWIQAKIDASDIVQQTLLEAHRDFERFEGQSEGEWLAWLRRILSHNAADYVRRYRGTAKRAAHREVPIRGAGDGSSVMGVGEPAAPGGTPSEEAVFRDDQLRMAEALTGLSPDHREVILLRNLQRLPFDEVARRMDRTRPAVQMLWTRAIKKLQEIMDV